MWTLTKLFYQSDFDERLWLSKLKFPGGSDDRNSDVLEPKCCALWVYSFRRLPGNNRVNKEATWPAKKQGCSMELQTSPPTSESEIMEAVFILCEITAKSRLCRHQRWRNLLLRSSAASQSNFCTFCSVHRKQRRGKGYNQKALSVPRHAPWRHSSRVQS